LPIKCKEEKIRKENHVLNHPVVILTVFILISLPVFPLSYINIASLLATASPHLVFSLTGSFFFNPLPKAVGHLQFSLKTEKSTIRRPGRKGKVSEARLLSGRC
jgi:hypothetical protein